MKVQNNTINDYKYSKPSKVQPSFGSLSGALQASGALMHGIENQGFWLSFLIQDFGGMTVPRTVAGFLRDKEVTGEYNTQEGLEVLGREGLTGPCMMAVAPLSLLLAAKFGKSTSVNTQLIKRFGTSLKELVSKPDFDKELLKNPEKFKEYFYKVNIERILEDTLAKENVKQESVNYIMQQLANRSNIPAGEKLARFRGKAKYRNKCMENIVEHINNLKYESGTDLDMLQKVHFSLAQQNDKKSFMAKDVFDALEKYTNDAISMNKSLEKLDSLQAESIKDKSLAKRMITNISMIAATLGVLSVLPKIYAYNDVAPGARKNAAKGSSEFDSNNSEIAFKGKSKPGLLERLGKFVDKIKSDFASSELEYNGHNFTNTLMAGLSVFGLIIPRGCRAYSRAQENENGKKDLTELWEIFIRDLTSSLAVVFAVPMGTRAFVTMYEKNSGFVLMNKDRTRSKLKTFLDLFNPYSKAHVLTNSEISALYGNIDTKNKMVNFCKYIDKNGGDLHKIISKSENVDKVFNKSTLDFASLKGLKKAEKNKKILSFIENYKAQNADELIKNLMKGAGSLKKNKIASFARGLNSVPGLLTTFFISPYILGWFIPRLTYRNTRRIHEKEDREKALKEQTDIKKLN